MFTIRSRPSPTSDAFIGALYDPSRDVLGAGASTSPRFPFSRTDRAAELRSREPGAIVIVVVVCNKLCNKRREKHNLFRVIGMKLKDALSAVSNG